VSRVAIVGAGVAGLTAGYRLAQQGRSVDVYERWPGLGGQAATLDVGDGVLLERYYHHLFTSDEHIAALYAELGLEIDFLPSQVGFFAAGANHPFTTPGDLLRFKPLTPAARVRMGLAVLFLQRRYKEVGPLEGRTAREWVVRAMGPEAWDRLWGPLMRGKFSDRADEISMAWLWARLKVRRQVKGSEARGEVLGYPRGGFEPLFRRLAEEIEKRGGRVLIDRPAARVSHSDGRFVVTAGGSDSFRSGHDPRVFAADGDERYDALLATVANPIFERLLDDGLRKSLTPGYLAKLQAVDYHAALCLVLELDRQFSPFYWTNVADPQVPFLGLIEQTNFVDPREYGGRRFLYVANYVAPGDRLLDLDADELLAAYEPALRRMNQSYDSSWVRAKWIFREPDAQPIVTVGYRERIPPLETGVPGLLLANTTQIFPEDRGTNYAVRLGEEVAGALLTIPG
jgi:protoporphyrinogen oxidase